MKKDGWADHPFSFHDSPFESLPSGVTENSAASAGPVHADQFVRHFGVGRDSGVNALRLSAKIRVECAEDHTCVVSGSMLMKAKKVAAIVGQENPAISHRERQDLGIRHGQIRLSGIQRSD